MFVQLINRLGIHSCLIFFHFIFLNMSLFEIFPFRLHRTKLNLNKVVFASLYLSFKILILSIKKSRKLILRSKNTPIQTFQLLNLFLPYKLSFHLCTKN